MSERLLFGKTIAELEAMVDAAQWSVSELTPIQYELHHRTTRRSKVLLKEVNRRIGAANAKSPAPPIERDRTQIFELHDIATLKNGFRVAVSDSRGLVSAGVRLYHERETISKRLLEAAVGDEVELLNGKSTIMVSIEKGGALPLHTLYRKRVVSNKSDQRGRSVMREDSAIRHLILNFLRRFRP